MSIFDVYPNLLDDEYVSAYPFEKCYTRQDRLNPYADEDVAAALILSDGNLSESAKLLNRSRRSLEQYILKVSFLRDLQDDIEAEFLDTVEGMHRGAALAGDLTTQRFFLSTKGKDRGYVARSEATGKDGGPIHTKSQVDVSKMSDGALEEMLKATTSHAS
jgi:hypothetical protein